MNFYHHLTMPAVTSILANKKLILPVGTIEQHGPHLPLSVDLDLPEAISAFIAKKINALIAPPICYGARSLPQSGGGSSFPGTIAVRAEPLIGYYHSIIQSFVQHGTRELIIINGHYENEPFLFEALEQCRENGILSTTNVIAFSWWSMVTAAFITEHFQERFPGWHAEHAGVVETSLMMYLYPQLVKDCLVDHYTPPLAGIYVHPIDSAAISNQGVLARTSEASAAIGEILFAHICQNIIAFIANPHGMKKTDLETSYA